MAFPEFSDPSLRPLAKWKTPFDPHDTFRSRFHVSKQRPVKVSKVTVEHLTTPTSGTPRSPAGGGVQARPRRQRTRGPPDTGK